LKLLGEDVVAVGEAFEREELEEVWRCWGKYKLAEMFE
jgi:hypothetical protein